MWDCEIKEAEENWPLPNSKKEKIENHEENKFRKWEEKDLRVKKCETTKDKTKWKKKMS